MKLVTKIRHKYTGLWKHCKDWLNGLGGTRDNMIQERLDEWRFHRDYLRDDTHQYNFWKMLKILAAKGNEAKMLVDADAGDDED